MAKKRIMTIQDYSCLGRCSLTVALPTISAAGIECVGIPTSLLSNHTAFPDWTFCDLTSEIAPMSEKIASYSPDFDMIYTGYLSTRQVKDVIALIGRFKKENTAVLVDPACADEGKIYAGFGPEHIVAMRELIAHADIIKPNLTEACLLSGFPYPERGIPSQNDLVEILARLSKLGHKVTILSGLPKENGNIITIAYDHSQNKIVASLEAKKLEGLYHGTGDLFASALASVIVLGHPLQKAIEIAHNLVVNSIKANIANNINGKWYGPEFEDALPQFIAEIKALKA